MGAASSKDNLEEVTFKSLMNDEKAWDRQMESTSVSDCLKDGKLLADFAVFLKEKYPELAVKLWVFDLARCAPHPDQDEIKCSSTVASDLQKAWDEYLVDPTGKLNLDDVDEFKSFKMKQGKIDENGTGGKKLVNKQNAMYQFACQAMFGIHTATLCDSFVQDALALGLGSTGNALDSWMNSFPQNDLVDSLQRSYRTFTIPADGSAYSPECSTISNGAVDDEFLFEEFCPQLFAQMRSLLGISNAEYFKSLCRVEKEFLCFGTNSKSGEFFFFSHDNKYLLKTTTQEEAELLMTMLPDFLGRLQTTPHTFLGKYLGLYRIGKRLFFVMRAVSTHTKKITRTYDIKGALKNRDAPETDGIGLDFNFRREVGTISVDPEVAVELAQTHADDCEVLKHHGIMDFSLLVQVHDTQAPAKKEEGKTKTRGVTMDDDGTAGCHHAQGTSDTSGLAGAGSQWFASGGPTKKGVDVAFEDSYRSISSKSDVEWRPDAGVWSTDGRYLFTFGLIDILVPYTLKPKVQYCFEQIGSCGHGDDYSRIPPDYYCDRQVELFHELLDVALV